eukprot:TRINITY_DN9136_c0_g1_i2.p3 TRINITY_DN9136_c0_g1~~TRINITY_DN9136_c0_g1_i2.p3  ORF type:complete len:187 (+),score=45.24 TRINITY_DN9136_c0_g1_i2:62-562(+)
MCIRDRWEAVVSTQSTWEGIIIQRMRILLKFSFSSLITSLIILSSLFDAALSTYEDRYENNSYKVSGHKKGGNFVDLELEYIGYDSQYLNSPIIKKPQATLIFENQNQIDITIKDQTKRWEIPREYPFPFKPETPKITETIQLDFLYNIMTQPFGIQLTRTSTISS